MRLATSAFLTVSSVCLGWGYDGHRIVGEIASHFLTPDAKAGLNALLGDKTLADVSTWADDIKSDRTFDWAKPLHYANVKPGSKSFDIRRDCPDVGCVVSAIDQCIRALQNPKTPKPEKIQALKFLVHFVGDIHQPLHVSHAKDRGGNDVSVEFFQDKTNLHSVWDSGLIRHTKKPWRDYATELMGGANAGLGDEGLVGLGSLRAADWATESYRLAISHAYDVPKDGKIAEAYFERNIPVVNDRLRTAGMRLARILNDLFMKTP